MTKRKTLSFVFTFSMVIALALSMATPAMARTYNPYNTKNTYFLNIYGNSGAPMNGRGLTIYDTSIPEEDQQFLVVWCSGSGYNGPCLTSLYEPTYAVNRSSASDRRAIMWNLASGIRDSLLQPSTTVNSSMLQLQYGNQEFLTAKTPVANQTAVYWGGTGVTVWN